MRGCGAPHDKGQPAKSDLSINSFILRTNECSIIYLLETFPPLFLRIRNTQYSIRNTNKLCKTNPIFDEMNVSASITREYENLQPCGCCKNKPNSNPIYVKLGNLKYEILSEFCILCSVFCVPSSVFCVLYSVFCILCSVFYMLTS
jgi:hypothetical protein